MLNLNLFKKNYSRPGRFGDFGGRYVAETLMQPLMDLEKCFYESIEETQFKRELSAELKHFVGRETPLYQAKNLGKHLQQKIYLKREDLNHTGSHKINNALGQVLLAIKMGKKRIVAETGAGQHGVATASVCAHFGLECIIYMGSIDVRRQQSNVKRMEMMGAKVIAVENGSKTLKDAVSEAMRDWISRVDDTYYLLGSALGPHPYPTMVREFQSIIGMEARAQILERENRLPNEIVACVGGGSNAIGIFHSFLHDTEVKLFGIEAGGLGVETNLHAARFQGGKTGVFQGTHTYVLQNEDGQISSTHSISAGLDYAAVGPEHSYLHKSGRVVYEAVTDREAKDAFFSLAKNEGIIPALESSHAIAFALKRAAIIPKGSIILINLSGRGDKDLSLIEECAHV